MLDEKIKQVQENINAAAAHLRQIEGAITTMAAIQAQAANANFISALTRKNKMRRAGSLIAAKSGKS